MATISPTAFPLATEAVAALRVRSCVVDAEAIVCDDSVLAVFDLIRGYGRNNRAMLCAFDLLEVNGEDVRPEPIEDRKRRLAGLLRLPHHGIALNETYRGDSAMTFKHACVRLGCEGIVSKRLGTPYRAGRSNHWLKIKNPAAPAVRRLEGEIDHRGGFRFPPSVVCRRNGRMLLTGPQKRRVTLVTVRCVAANTRSRDGRPAGTALALADGGTVEPASFPESSSRAAEGNRRRSCCLR
jgi:hypothetical protein